MTTAIGWVATALFSASYFFKQQRTLLAIQIVAASVWILYGLGLGAVPVVVANVVVAASAGWSLWRISREERPGNATSRPAEATMNRAA